jgi:DNA-binding CsgD family transcriptional regulator
VLLDRIDGSRGPDTRHLRWVIGSIGSIRMEPDEWIMGLLAPDPDALELGPEDGWENPMVTQMAIAHLVLEQYGRASEIAAVLGEEGRRRGSALAALNAAAYSGALHSREGDLVDAEVDIRLAMDMISSAPLGLVGALSLFCFAVDAIVERSGLADVADIVIATDIPPDFARTATGALLNELRAAILAARGEREAAVERLRAAGRTWEPIGVGPRTSAWRSRLAVLLGPGSDEAMALAEAELGLARELDSARSIGVALRALGTIERGERGIESLTRSVAELRRAGARVELARSLTALGAAMRRERRTREAREQLREALELAQETGAERLEDRAFEELRIAGARPRRREVRGAGSLTPAERRVVEAAAGGATNREIAQDLFVSLRTVEMHLTNAYRKLGISSRDELAEAMAG